MPAFIPTHYTAEEILFYNDNQPAHAGVPRKAHEAVMLCDGPSCLGHVKVLCGDGYHSWVLPEQLYKGARRGT